MIHLTVKTETSEQKFMCTCINGHIFNIDIPVVINTFTHMELLKSLSVDGGWPVSCPVCQTSWFISNPVVIHQEQKEALKIYVPKEISHLSMEINAAVALSIAKKQGRVPGYFADYKIIFDKNAIIDTTSEVAHDKVLETKKGIHDAFADLSSIIPEPTAND